jgi:hypothetical protein
MVYYFDGGVEGVLRYTQMQNLGISLKIWKLRAIVLRPLPKNRQVNPVDAKLLLLWRKSVLQLIRKRTIAA